MEDFTKSVVTTLKDSIKEAMNEVANSIAAAVTDGIKLNEPKGGQLVYTKNNSRHSENERTDEL